MPRIMLMLTLAVLTGLTGCSESRPPNISNDPAVKGNTVIGPTHVPTESDFNVTVNVLRKKCFGSAGCNITYRIAPRYFGKPLSDKQHIVVTYEITGDENGPIVGSFSLKGPVASFSEKEFAHVPDSTTVLSAQVTGVLAD